MSAAFSYNTTGSWLGDVTLSLYTRIMVRILVHCCSTACFLSHYKRTLGPHEVQFHSMKHFFHLFYQRKNYDKHSDLHSRKKSQWNYIAIIFFDTYFTRYVNNRYAYCVTPILMYAGFSILLAFNHFGHKQRRITCKKAHERRAPYLMTLSTASIIERRQ